MKLFRRENYLSKIRGFYADTGIIKVITGTRRCGKSSLMHTIAEELVENGVDESNIIFIDLKKYGYRSIKEQEQLENTINSLLPQNDNTKYLFIDEIQNVKGFENVIESLRDEDLSIFITGSNSYLLSGELVTNLTGRYIEFEIFTLTFEEYIEMKKFYRLDISGSMVDELDKYIVEGGFPKALEYSELKDKRRYASSVVDEIFDKDIRHRVQIRNKEVFDAIMVYIINNFGSTTSIKNITDELHKKGINVKRETVAKYIQVLVDSKIIHRVKRFDLKSKESILSEEKYYLADLSFYFNTNTDNRINYGPVLENIVFLYAKSKDYQISVGRIGKLECDFILRDNQMNYAYIQVAMTIISSKQTEDREYAPLESIHDNWPKYILTRYDLIQRRGGIKHFNIPNFLSEGKLF